MGDTAPDPRGLGQSLFDITEEPTGDPEVDLLAGDELVAAAEGTPYLRRLRALREHVIDAGPLSFAAASATWRAAAPTAHERLATGEGRVVDLGLVTAVSAGLLATSPDDPDVRIRTGPECWLVTEHPLGAWGASLAPTLLGDPIPVLEPEPRWHDAAMRAVPCLLYQHVVKAGRSTPIAPALEVLHEEALLAASRMPGPVPVPSRPRVAAQLRAMLALHVELGLVSWEADGTVTGVGDAAPTGLGLFGWLVWMAVVDDELPPGFEELAAGAV